MELYTSNTLQHTLSSNNPLHNPNPIQTPQEENSSDIPVIPELSLRVPSSDSLFSFCIGQRQSSLPPEMMDMTPIFSKDMNHKMFFPQDIPQKPEAPERIIEVDDSFCAEGFKDPLHSENQIGNSTRDEKPGPIMIMERFSLSPNAENKDIKLNADTQRHDYSYRDSLETVGTTHDELKSSPSESIGQSRRKYVDEDYARPSYSIWNSVSHIDEHDNTGACPAESLAADEPEKDQEIQDIYTVVNKDSSVKGTTMLINRIRDLLVEQVDCDLLATDPLMFDKLINDVQTNKRRVTRVLIETTQDSANSNNPLESEDHKGRSGEKRINKSPYKLNIDIEKIQRPEEQQLSNDIDNLDVQKAKEAKQELASKFYELQSATKELVGNSEIDLSTKLKVLDGASETRQTGAENSLNNHRDYQRTAEEKRENWPEKKESGLEGSMDQLELEKNKKKSSIKRNFPEKDEIKQRRLKQGIEIQENQTFSREQEVKGDKPPSAGMVRLVTMGIIGMLGTVLWYQLAQE